MSAPVARLVLVGASNVTRMLPTWIDLARSDAGGPVEVHAAVGFGRSYVGASRVLWRVLPGILDCGLWDVLDGLPEVPTLAVVADVGNDILYGFDVETILAHVDRVLDRLGRHADRLRVTGLPVAGIERVGPLRYGFVRTVIVPGCGVGRDDAAERARRLDAALRGRAVARGADFVPMRADWYGFDPVHVRLLCTTAACRVLGGFATDLAPARSWGTRCLERWRILGARAASRRLFGRSVRRAQPSAVLPDGSTLHLY